MKTFLENKLNLALTVFTLVGMLVGGLCFVGNSFWASESENTLAHEALKTKDAVISEKIIQIEGSIGVLDERTREMQNRQRRMDSKLDQLLGRR